MRAALAVVLTSILACGGGTSASSFGGMTQPGVSTAPSESGESTSGSSSGGPPVDSTSSTSSMSSSSTSASSGSDGTVWDMGMPDFGPVQPAGCEGKIDFLFVISAQGTMQPKQERLLASFPGFMSAIKEQLPDFDVHIMVANPNPKPGWGVYDCSLCMDDCDPMGQPPNCGAVLTPCDKKIGAGVTFPAGQDASNRRCELAGDRRYILGSDPAMTDDFACVAQAGTSGAARAGEAMVAALQPEINDPDDEYACNGGFLRGDALLVVTIIQDTYDETSTGTVDEWIAALRAAKNDDDDAFAVIVLTTDVDVDYQQLCHPNDFVPIKNRLRLLVEGIDHGFIGSICLPEYATFFADHVGALVDLCDDFVPPG